MAKAFKKGDLVTRIIDWDHKGTVVYCHAVVYSCGNKQMVLTCAETGEELGRNFAPTMGTPERGGVFPRMTDEAAMEMGLAMATRVAADLTARLTASLNGNHGAAYEAEVRKALAEDRTPRVTTYRAAVAAIRGAA